MKSLYNTEWKNDQPVCRPAFTISNSGEGFVCVDFLNLYRKMCKIE